MAQASPSTSSDQANRIISAAPIPIRRAPDIARCSVADRVNPVAVRAVLVRRVQNRCGRFLRIRPSERTLPAYDPAPSKPVSLDRNRSRNPVCDDFMCAQHRSLFAARPVFGA